MDRINIFENVNKTVDIFNYKDKLYRFQKTKYAENDISHEKIDFTKSEWQNVEVEIFGKVLRENFPRLISLLDEQLEINTEEIDSNIEKRQKLNREADELYKKRDELKAALSTLISD